VRLFGAYKKKKLNKKFSKPIFEYTQTNVRREEIFISVFSIKNMSQ
jgi:hypothetical protein